MRRKYDDDDKDDDDDVQEGNEIEGTYVEDEPMMPPPP